MLAVVVDDELGGIGVGLEAQLLSNETKLNVRFVTTEQLASRLSSPLVASSNIPFANIAHGRKALS
jgi:hypothetical protein